MRLFQSSKTPPIFVQGVNNFKEIIARLSKIISKDSCTIKSLASGAVRVNTDTTDNIRRLVKGLRNENL